MPLSLGILPGFLRMFDHFSEVIFGNSVYLC